MRDFAVLWRKYAGAREAEIRARFDCSPTHNWQRVHHLAATHEAALYAPTTGNQLRHIITRRRHARSKRRLAS